MLSLRLYVFSILLSAHAAWSASLPRSLSTREAQAQYLTDMAQAIESHRAEIIPLLNEIGATTGADYEVTQAIRTLQNAPEKELVNFKDVPGLRKLAVYGSSNIPLYTLTMQVLIPSLVFDRVVFKVSSKTKSLYLRLWAVLQKSVADRYDLSHVQMITSNHLEGAQDYMLEQISGARDGVPADAVVFTGNPQNGDELEAQVRQALQVSPVQNQRTIFLKFGAGMNPVIIDENANSAQWLAGVSASIEHFHINSGQDCISPNFSLLPLKDKDAAIHQIIESVSRLRFGGLTDPRADYSELTFGTQKDIKALADFKEKYLQYLVTDSRATIDPISKRVDPHVFVMPFEKFKELALEEFYAPFAVFFTYENKAQLEQMIHDPRLAKKAMFASLFGNPNTASFQQTRRALIRTRHQIFENASVFQGEDGNRPFGGFGSDVSTVNVIDKNAGKISDRRFVRPLLLSKEIRKAFVGLPVEPQDNSREMSPLTSRFKLNGVAVDGNSVRSVEEALRSRRSQDREMIRLKVQVSEDSVKGFEGFQKFVKSYFFMQKLVTEQQRYYASGKKFDYLPAGSLTTGLVQGLTPESGAIEIRNADPDALISQLKLVVKATDNRHDFSDFAAYEKITPLGFNSAQRFFKLYETDFSPAERRDLQAEKIDAYFQRHPELKDFLFPLQLWNLHPVIQKSEASPEYLSASRSYLLALNDFVQNRTNLNKLRESLGSWSWGLGKKTYSEMMTPWNSEMKALKKTLDEPRAVTRQCRALFSF